MKLSAAIEQLQVIQKKFGDLEIVGGNLLDDMPLQAILVVDKGGMEVFPEDPNGVAGKNAIDGVFLT